MVDKIYIPYISLRFAKNVHLLPLKPIFSISRILDAPCLNDHECHCEPPSPDNTPVCVDGHCQCLHAGWRLYLFKRFYILLFICHDVQKDKDMTNLKNLDGNLLLHVYMLFICQSNV